MNGTGILSVCCFYLFPIIDHTLHEDSWRLYSLLCTLHFMEKKTIIEQYFHAREAFDVDAFLKLVADTIEIHNVHFPVYYGTDGVRAYVRDIQQKMSHSAFEILAQFENGTMGLVEWRALLTFRAGALIAENTVKTPFTLTLRGATRFDFEGDKITCVRMYHETTSFVQMAKEHSV